MRLTVISLFSLCTRCFEIVAFAPFKFHSTKRDNVSISSSGRSSKFLLKATRLDNDAAFAAFSASLEDDEKNSRVQEENFVSAEVDDSSTWQASLEMLLDPNTTQAKRQILLSDLLNSNAEIRESVLKALRERKVRDLPLHDHPSLDISHVWIDFKLLFIRSTPYSRPQVKSFRMEQELWRVNCRVTSFLRWQSLLDHKKCQGDLLRNFRAFCLKWAVRCLMHFLLKQKNS